MSNITLKGVTKSFKDTKVLNSIDLEIAEGEFLTLVGPSGCGKSTTLRIIAGLEQQSSGDVSIADRLVNDVRPSQRDLAMVFQSYALYPHLSVYQNLLTPLKLRDLNFWERFPLLGSLLPGKRTKLKALTAQVHEVADTLKIMPLLARKPGQLSGGQRQRVALGRAMVRKPVAFLMDEPLSNLDAGLRVHMRAELAELHRSLGTTFIYVTHDQAEALTMSDRMAVMMDGDILQIGTPDDVYQQPDNLLVAQFVGSPQINLLSATCDSTGRLSCLGLNLSRSVTNQPGNAVQIGIRSEHVSILPVGSAHSLQGQVTHKENLGSEVFVHLLLNDDTTRMVVRANPEQAQLTNIGESIFVGLAEQKLLAFGPDGQRLPMNDSDHPVNIAKA